MDVFRLHKQLIDDYSAFSRSFVDIDDGRIAKTVEEAVEGGLLWPDPWIQLNPMFEAGESTDELVAEDILHPECANIFRIKRALEDEGTDLRFHRHQSEAIKVATQGENYLLTTGTGSGKSLAYIVPIVDHVLKVGTGQGIRAIVVYPMNALANSQLNELEKFLKFGYPDGKGPVTFNRYTGQENDEQKQEIRLNPPDILLTNYVMLEYVLTRPQDRDKLIGSAAGQLRYLVLDELHTYRGRQGSDVGMLVRRTRDACASPDLRFVGTSATLASGGSEEEQRAELAEVATQMFGAEVKAENVIGETLRRATTEYDFTQDDQRQQLTARLSKPPPTERETFLADPLASWIESSFGLERSPETGQLVRSRPRTISGEGGAARALAELTGVDEAACAEAIKETLLVGWQVQRDEAVAQAPTFAFRLHQFLSKGDTVYATLEPEDERYLSTVGQMFCPHDRDKVLFPLVFCRECGQEYYTVVRHTKGTAERRDFSDLSANNEKGQEAGFLFIDTDAPWPTDEEEVKERLPSSWLFDEDGYPRVDKNRLDDIPTPIRLNTKGEEDDAGLEMLWIPAPFRFCLKCKVSYDTSLRSDYTKVSRLSTEGRSSATSLISLSVIRGLQSDTSLKPTARKLLSFTDNRQDASLQAGHFNDFVEVGLMRGALYRAVSDAGDEGLAHDELAQQVYDALALDVADYARDPDVRFAARKSTDTALREVLAYRIYNDLKRGWRVTLPNLEQVGLLRIEYESLDELAAAEDVWGNKHAALTEASPETRADLCQILLDDLRRNLAVNVKWLTPEYQERLKAASEQYLNAEWALDEGERLSLAKLAYPRPSHRRDSRWDHFISGRGGFGRWLGRPKALPHVSGKLGLADREKIIQDLLEALRVAGLVEIAREATEDGEVPGYQVRAGEMRWKAADGSTPFYDPLRNPDRAETGGRANPFFVDFYRRVADELRGLRAREHTAQVLPEIRQQREDDFREAELPILYCSPTMELGIDIAELNAVHLRNVPPTPANYAQRSGRAGREGQPAIVTSYCASGSPHDQYFFRRSDEMVFGAVAPPRLDLLNEDLIREHIQAVWLAETGKMLGKSMRDVLDLSTDGYPVLGEVRSQLEAPGAIDRARTRGIDLLATIGPELLDAHWYTDGWLDEVLTQMLQRFDRAFDRWRDLYKAARDQAQGQSEIAQDPSAGPNEKRRARRLRAQAESQLDLLTAEGSDGGGTDFYPYRYLASEGFLPGYNFPRLPLSAYIPGYSAAKKRDEYLQRPRFLAISEFGPGALVYHEGSRYQITDVVLPPGRAEDGYELPLRQAKQCSGCGYLHPFDGNAGPDVCERCHKQLGAPLTSLFRMSSVKTRRRERINSDEEERQRLGYELRTGVRFAKHGERPGRERAVITDAEGEELAELVYGDAATIWRINLGWRRRSENGRLGFVLDLETGRWLAEKDLQQADDDLPEAGKEKRVRRVVPYVEDRRNCLIYEPGEKLSDGLHASLGAALKTAIQAEFQLEDGELAVEPLPDSDVRRGFLLYEASEGGAGVLRRLVREADSLPRVARRALDICHFDPDTGEDLHRAPRAREDCEAACYDCLMSYRNQREHELLDRQLVKDLLFTLRDGSVVPAPADVSRAEHLANLKKACDSDLERGWLDLLQEHTLHLPTHAQKLIESCEARPDFLYAGEHTAVFIDGPHHEGKRQAERDEQADSRLTDAGYSVLRFRYDERDGWLELMKKYPTVFGEVR